MSNLKVRSRLAFEVELYDLISEDDTNDMSYFWQVISKKEKGTTIVFKLKDLLSHRIVDCEVIAVKQLFVVINDSVASGLEWLWKRKGETNDR